MTKPKINFVAYFFLFISLFLNLFLVFKLKQSTLSLVTHVSDGDTIVINDNQVLRLANLNAPELDMCGGLESKAFLEKLILGKKITFKGLSYDGYHRTLAMVYLNGQNINQLLISSGWAYYDSNFKEDRELLSNSAQGAKAGQTGVYTLCRANPPSEKCLIKANNNHGQNIYFLPSCSNYKNTVVETDKGDNWFCTEAEAQKAGYKKSGDCR